MIAELTLVAGEHSVSIPWLHIGVVGFGIASLLFLPLCISIVKKVLHFIFVGIFGRIFGKIFKGNEDNMREMRRIVYEETEDIRKALYNIYTSQSSELKTFLAKRCDEIKNELLNARKSATVLSRPDKDHLRSFVNQKVAVVCNKYVYWGYLSRVRPNTIVLNDAVCVEQPGYANGDRPEIADPIYGPVTISFGSIETIYQPKWSQSPLPSEMKE